MTSKRGKGDFLELVKSNRRAPPKPPHLLTLIQKNTLDHSQQLLKLMFVATDDALYDLSQRASSHSEENLYFESMREFRIKTQGIFRHFRQNIIVNFSKLIEVEDSSKTRGPAPTRTLSIMDAEQLEIELALNTMVNRARDLYRTPLHELNTRLDHLLHIEVDKSNNPLDPHRIAGAFVEACAQTLSIDIKVRLVLFKLFEKHLLKQLTPLYSDANRFLVDAGILPTVPPQLGTDKTMPSTPEDDGAPQAEQASTSQASDKQPHFNVSLDTLASLLASARGAARDAENTGEGGGSGLTLNCYIFATDNPGPLMSAPRLTAMLTRSQLMADRQLIKGPHNILSNIITTLLAKADANAPQALAETDETIINLVSLFFDEILADDSLPLAVQALICRLQIPVLKIALKDHSFFSNHNHAARCLINTITEVGIGFEENKPLERDPVYRSIVDIVQTISREHKVDDVLFSNLHSELATLLAVEQRKVHVVEKRTGQSAAGRAKIRMARTSSQNLLYDKLHTVMLPQEISDFLTTAWLQVLIITQLKHGCDSAEWVANENTASDLIWLCQKHEDVQSLARRTALQPELLQRVEVGLETAIESPQVRAAKVKELQAALTCISNTPQQLTYSTLSNEQKEALGRAEPSPEPAFASSTAQTHIDEQGPYDKNLEIARDIREGTWVEYLDAENGEKFRYKLAAKIDSTAYVFVNRKGFKTIERTCTQLAHDLTSNKARLLTSGEFFDRMMNKVLSSIKQAA